MTVFGLFSFLKWWGLIVACMLFVAVVVWCALYLKDENR